ncbi:methyltransferase, FxLD system [Planosporangium thailandense]|uniref:Protein-L-isoaspartate O-methyltransferase n=1 Tax=Planosporangium thailandense TaxID=765197 RepID=A0ABX0Y3R3_9ACTN|nr:methyltransferase, FxLD system [Planosporangium thailandense]NJC73026.1 methyltransferase, FxLD system [Planosporangium thailandense]
MDTTTDCTPEVLRTRMVDQIVGARATSAPVEAALRAVPRHAFVPEATLDQAYDVDLAVITKRSSDGTPLSCASVPSLVATMLDQLQVASGDRILEIGAGTGYNAALLAHLTGPTGQVTTVDIDPDVTAGARRTLDATGHRDVHVITRDGALGDPERAPYDRIIVTVGAWDIPTAWTDQLAPGGRLVVPLRWRGQTRSVAFTHDDGRLVSDSVELCGFVPMIGQDGERSGPIDADGQVMLYWDADQPIDPAVLQGVLDQPQHSVWSGVTVVANEPFDGIWLRLTSVEPGTCRITATPAAIESGRCDPAIPSRSPALVEDASLAYLTLRRHTDDGDERRWELGAAGHGPTGPELADRLCDQIRAWAHDRTAQPLITAYSAGDSDDQLPSTNTITKPCVRLTVVY